MEQRQTFIFQDATAGIDDVSALEVAAAVLSDYFDVVEPITVYRFGVMPTVTFDYDTQTAEGVVTLQRRVAYGSDVGIVALTTIATIEATPAGTAIISDFDPIECDVGDQLVPEATTAATGGGAIAGDFITFIVYKHRPESVANQSEQIATT